MAKDWKKESEGWKKLGESFEYPPGYKPPVGHDKHLSDAERAHSGVAGSKVRHGADATGKLRANGLPRAPALSEDEKRRRGYINDRQLPDDQAHWPESSKFVFPKKKTD